MSSGGRGELSATEHVTATHLEQMNLPQPVHGWRCKECVSQSWQAAMRGDGCQAVSGGLRGEEFTSLRFDPIPQEGRDGYTQGDHFTLYSIALTSLFEVHTVYRFAI